MTPPTRRIANVAVRALRTVRHQLFPNFNPRNSALARAYLRWASSAARLDEVDVLGHRMALDDRDSLRLSVARLMEPTLTRFVQEAVKPGDTVLDVGANIGYFTLLFARAVGPGGRVVAIEPDPENVALLTRNVARNGYADRVTVLPRAAWDASGPLRLFRSEENRGDHQTYDIGEGRESVTIDALRVDDYAPLAAGPPVALVKMDIQGAEYRALLGMRELLARSRDVVLLTEFWPLGLQRAGTPPAAYLDLIASMGFGFLDVPDDRDEITPATPAELLARNPVETGDATNLICRRP
jgi:FkbM family methyltransferase